MKNIKIIIVWMLILFSSTKLLAQNDSVRQQNDSLTKNVLDEYKRKIVLIEQQRIKDSIANAELQNQLSSLKSSDIAKKEEIQKKLLALNDSQAERLRQKKIQIDSLRQTVKGFPVIGFFNDTLFLIYNRLGSFSAEDRSMAISNRIHKVSENLGFKADSLKILDVENTTYISLGENIIMSVSENDALWMNRSRDSLANKYRQIIAYSIEKYKSETSFVTLLKEIGLALLVILIIWLLIVYISKFFKWTSSKIQEQQDKNIKGIKLKNYTLLDSGRQVNALLNANNILKWIIILLAIYIALPILFGIFPWTKNFASILFSYILNPINKITNALWNYLPNLVTIIVIIIIFRYLLKGIHFLKNEIEKGDLKLPGFYPDWANPTFQIIRVLVFAFMVIVIFPYLPGSDSPVFRGVSVFLGFLFTFGSAGSLSNIIAGLVLTYMRLFKLGDRVKIGEVTGDVIEKSLLVTRIRTIKNEIISIPNSTVMSSHTINYSSDAPEKGLIIHTTVTIGYAVPWREMHQALIDAAVKTELVLPEPKPFVLQISLDDFYVSYQVNGYIRDAGKQASIYSNLHQNIQDVCNERGIEIMSPHYVAARDGNTSGIPADYLPKDYKAPGFNVNIKKAEGKD
jgi:small-conductance mechanosensitive channel